MQEKGHSTMDKRQLLGSTSLTDMSAKPALDAGEWPVDFPDCVCYVRQLRSGETHPTFRFRPEDYLAFNKEGEFIASHDHAGELFIYLYKRNLFPVMVH